MSERLRKVDRVLKVQQQLQKMAEVKLAGLQRQALELKAVQEELIGTMSEHNALHGLFIDTMARRLQRLATEAAQVETATSDQKEAVLQRAMQVKRVEKLSSNLAEEERRSREKKELLSILEGTATRKDASFP